MKWISLNHQQWQEYKSRYHLSVMLGLMLSQLLLIVLFKWPFQIKEPEPTLDLWVSREEFVLEPMIITKQNVGAAAPPKPIIPALAPEYILIEEEFITLEEPNLIEEEMVQAMQGSTGWLGEEDAITGDPDRMPRTKKIVEPSYTNAALSSDLKVMVSVEMIISSKGRVEEAYVSSIVQTLDDGSIVRINSVGFDILASILEAAVLWEYTPAFKDGLAVKTQKTEIFLFGF